MQTILRALLAALVLASALETPVYADQVSSFCREYSGRAVAFVKTSVNLGCGYEGARWSGNERAHGLWCMRATRTDVLREQSARAEALQKCSRCRDYAKSALAQNTQNRQRSCGFTGPRWHRDAQTYQDWCMRAAPWDIQSETLARDQALATCKSPAIVPTACKSGYVWRAARPSDLVCVTPAARARTAQENADAAKFVDPAGGNTCISGYVWREAFEGDLVCVTPAVRAIVRQENAAAESRIEGN